MALRRRRRVGRRPGRRRGPRLGRDLLRTATGPACWRACRVSAPVLSLSVCCRATPLFCLTLRRHKSKTREEVEFRVAATGAKGNGNVGVDARDVEFRLA